LIDNLSNSFFSFSNRDDIIAIFSNNLQFSYRELFDQSKTIADFFASKQINKNDYVPILIADQISFIKTITALWYLGAVPVPINSRLTNQELFSIIEEYDFKFLITDIDISFEPLSLGGKLMELNSSHENTKTQNFTKINLAESISFPQNKIKCSIPELNNEAVVIFTSGSTGKPKGVVLTFSSLINSIENGNQILNQQENDPWLASLPFYHIGGFQIICRSLCNGCSIVIPDSFQTDDLAKTIFEFNPTHLSLVSTQLEKLIYQKVDPGNQLKISLIGGGFIDDDLIIEADKLGWKPHRVYGSSETASFVTAISADEIKQKPHSVGKALCNVEIKISDDSEILIKSNSLFKQYLDDEKETSAKLTNSFYHTGDLGFVDEDGYLFIEARRNDLIITGGENVNPIEVEKAISKIKGITEVCVFPKPNKTWGQIIACVLVSVDKSLDGKIIKEIIKKTLAGFKIPKEFIFTDKLPRTSLGKLEREKIRKMF
jgi:o-succinylbenzoate---CoA ligase